MAEEAQSLELPMFISVDDHVVEPHGLWQDRLPAKYREARPAGRASEGPGRLQPDGAARLRPVTGRGIRWCDVWYYEDTAWPMHAAFAAVGPTATVPATTALTYDDLLPGCFDQTHRLADMDANHTEASLCFPTVPRFCGQLFLNRQDMELARLCVRAYNDCMIEEWCGGAGRRSPDPSDAGPVVGRRRWPRPRCAAAPTWDRMRWPSPRARRSSACRASTPGSGSRSSPPAPRPKRSSTCTSARRPSSPRPRRVPP